MIQLGEAGWLLPVDGMVIDRKKPALANWLCWQRLNGGNINARSALTARKRLEKTGWSTYPVWIGHTYADAECPLFLEQAFGGFIAPR